MKKNLMATCFAATFAAFIASPMAVHADTWNVDPAHSSIGFSITHMGISKVHGNFEKFTGKIDFDGTNVTAGSVEFDIETASITTGDEKRDGHVTSADFLDAAKYPTLHFKSTGVKATKDGFMLNGNLSMHGVEKDVVIYFALNGPVDDMWGNRRIGIDGHLTLTREAFGVGWADMKLRPPLIGNDVKITIALEAVKG